MIDRPSEREPGDGEAHHGAAPERHWQRLAGPRFCCLGGAGIGDRGDGHADVPRTAGQHGTEHVRDSGERRDDHRQQDRHRDDEHGDPLVLLVQERSGAVLNLGHQEDHAFVAWRLGLDELVVVEREQQRGDG